MKKNNISEDKLQNLKNIFLDTDFLLVACAIESATPDELNLFLIEFCRRLKLSLNNNDLEHLLYAIEAEMNDEARSRKMEPLAFLQYLKLEELQLVDSGLPPKLAKAICSRAKLIRHSFGETQFSATAIHREFLSFSDDVCGANAIAQNRETLRIARVKAIRAVGILFGGAVTVSNAFVSFTAVSTISWSVGSLLWSSALAPEQVDGFITDVLESL